MVEITVPAALGGERLDRAVALVCDCSRSVAATLIAEGRVLINDRPETTRSVRVNEGDQVSIVGEITTAPQAPDPDSTVAVTVLYEDESVAVIDKPAGLVVHPGAGNRTGTLVNGLLHRFPEIAEVGQPDRPGIVHRLDKGTSGVMMIARTPEAYDSLVSDLSVHAVERDYIAICWGALENDRGVIDAPIGRSARQRTKMTVTTDGRRAATHYQVIARRHDDPALTLTACRLETGRTHQIRVHLRAIGHAVIADDLYAPRSYRFVGLGDGSDGRFGLHARQLRFSHPMTGESITVSAEPPSDMAEAITEYFGSIPASALDWQA